ncbi:enterochelin esterase [Streptomyces sp. NPDC051907]|uniref:enterochelin esterase n=1 Tax=Streptomyces sp. NPDC051907 TaxID=3155284 RepID=UPI00342806DD
MAPDGEARPLPRPVASPAVERLAQRLRGASDGEREALTAEFWSSVQTAGAPLVEALDDDPDHRAVTFLWRGHRATRRVLLLANRLVDRDRLADSLFSRLEGTDVWYLCYRLRADHRGSYQIVADISPAGPPLAGDALQQRLQALSAHAARDPLNPLALNGRWRASESSVFELPKAPPQPWRAPRPHSARGTVEKHRLLSYALDGERDVWVYLPPGGETGPLDVLTLCDGDMWFGRLALQRTLDALIADGAVPPVVVLSPDAVDNATRWREMGARDLYVDFLADELLPWAARRWPLTSDPARTVVAGQSLGGLAALYAGFTRPERFGNALAQSPSLWWRPGMPRGVPKGGDPDSMPWLAQRFADEDRRDIRVHLDVGLHEGAMVDYSRTLHGVLHERGYPVTRTEFNGGHDYACWRGGLADGLVSFLGR